MKESIRKVFYDFFWLLPFPIYQLLLIVCKHFGIKLSEDEMLILISIIGSILVFIRCKATPATVLFPKDAHIKWSLLLLLTFAIILIVILPKLLSIKTSYIVGILNSFKNNGFELYSNIFANKPSMTFIIRTVIAAPFLEELLLRYVCYTSMKARYESVVIAMIISSCLFGALHIFTPGYDTGEIVVLSFLGLFCAYAFEVTGSILSSIILHAFHNALVVFLDSLLFAYSVSFALVLALVSLLILLIALVVFVVRKILARKIKYAEAGEVIDAPFIPQVATTVDEVLPERCSSRQADDIVDGTPNPPQVKSELDTQK